MVAGEEPLVLQETLDAIRAAARKAGFSEREVLDVERGFSWQRVVDACASLSLFATQRIIEVRLATSRDDEGRTTLQALAAKLQRDTLLRSEQSRVGTGVVDTVKSRRWRATIKK